MAAAVQNKLISKQNSQILADRKMTVMLLEKGVMCLTVIAVHTHTHTHSNAIRKSFSFLSSINNKNKSMKFGVSGNYYFNLS